MADTDHPAWFCWVSKPNQEHIVCRCLARQGFRVFLPLEPPPPGWQSPVAGERDTRRPLFTGYGFVLFSLLRDRWGPIRNTPGVSRLLTASGSRDDYPAPVPEAVIAELERRPMPDEQGDTLRPGDRARFRLGGFTYEGLCTMTAHDRIAVLLAVLGGERRVWVARADCERVVS
jgi:transcription antitermination factor NusG